GAGPGRGPPRRGGRRFAPPGRDGCSPTGAGGGRGVSAPPLRAGLAVDAGVRVRKRLEPFERDPATRGHTDTVGARAHALERAVDVLDDEAGRRRQEEIALPLHAPGVAPAPLFVPPAVPPPPP